MARRYKRYYSRNRSRPSKSSSKSRIKRGHIEEAKRFSSEMGGTDLIVKEYFFSLTPEQLKPILVDYQEKYGVRAREYAEVTISKWREGQVQMSGMIAKRLFDLIPPYMPIEKKFEITEKLWELSAPSSSKTFYVEYGLNTEEIMGVVTEHLDNVVSEFTIPKNIEEKFNWLSQGDISTKQQLLNHINTENKNLSEIALQQQLEILNTHLSSDEGQLTKNLSHLIDVNNHKVNLIFHKAVSGISDVAPPPPPRKQIVAETDGGLGCALWMFVGVLIFLYFAMTSQ